jgi:ABC-2 type transport system permease protein
MNQFLTFVKKEFAHVMRDRKTLFILFGMPLAQILIFGFALTNEIKNSKIAVLDNSKDLVSTKIIERINASRFFEVAQELSSHKQIEDAFRSGDIRLVIVFPEDLSRQLQREHGAKVQVLADATDPNTANMLSNYIASIIFSYQQEVNGPGVTPMTIMPEVKMLYNPQLRGAPNFVPGVMALVLMLVCVMMTAISIVKEKETGTMEILLVSPFKPLLVIFAKAVPYFVLSLVNVISILLLSTFVLDLPVNGSVILLFGESMIFIITCLSLGILISTKASSQQVAMLISLMGMLLPTMLFSGFMFPIENMPLPLQIISNVVPSKWFYIIVKSVMIKGLGLGSILKETLILLGMAIVFLAISLKNFKLRLA